MEPSGEAAALVVTAAGPTTIDSLGAVLAKEHLMHDARSLQPNGSGEYSLGGRVRMEILGQLRCNPWSCEHNCVLDTADEALEELGAYKRAGGGCVVDASLPGCGRGIETLELLQKESGVNIIACTGWGVHSSLPKDVLDVDSDTLMRMMTRELTEGVVLNGKRLGPRTGCIAVGLSSDPTTIELKILHSAAETQATTGAPLLVACSGGNFDRLDCLLSELQQCNACMGKVFFSGIGSNTHPSSVLQRIWSSGAGVIFDGVGCLSTQNGNFAASDELISRDILSAERDGFASQCMVATGGMFRCEKSRYGGNGMAYALETFFNRLQCVGLPSQSVNQMLVDTPAKWLSWWHPAVAEEKEEEVWACHMCRGLSPVSVDGFHKWEFRYCSMKCLQLHRRQLGR